MATIDGFHISNDNGVLVLTPIDGGHTQVSNITSIGVGIHIKNSDTVAVSWEYVERPYSSVDRA